MPVSLGIIVSAHFLFIDTHLFYSPSKCAILVCLTAYQIVTFQQLFKVPFNEINGIVPNTFSLPTIGFHCVIKKLVIF